MMKKILLISAGFMSTILLIGTLLTVRSGKSNPVPSGAPGPEVTGEMGNQNSTWTDPAGFSFQYPNGVTINKHEEDQESYAHVELTHRDHPGNLIVWMKDTKEIDIRKWVKSEKRFKDTIQTDTILAGVKALEIRRETGDKIIVMAALSEGLVTSIEADLNDKEYWAKLYSQITQTFEFQPILKDEVNAEDVPADEEEIIE